METIQDALQTAFKENGFGTLQLVTDGGPENDNRTIQDFMRQSSIQHTIALRDIVQSNSTMEAFYRITKYQWLYRKKIKNGKQLQKEFEHWINEYHFEKPHYGLGIYTPYEILTGSNKTDNFSERMKAAAQERRIFNKHASCTVKCCD